MQWLIRVEDLLALVKKNAPHLYFIIAPIAMMCPNIDAKPVNHGKWIKGTYTSACSECMQRTKHIAAKYCPECGAKMDLEEPAHE